MAIFILEDNVVHSKYICKIIINSRLSIKENINIFNSIKDLSAYFTHNMNKINLYFLDITIENVELAGFKIAKTIREQEPSSLIVFVTSHPEFALLSYDFMTSAFSYIIKNNNSDEFSKRINQCLQSYVNLCTNKIENFFMYEDKFVKLKIPFVDLYYFTSLPPHKVLIKTKNKEIMIHSSLRQFECVEYHFLRCHKSFIVNVQNIQSYSKSSKEITLKNNEIIPTSRSFYKKLAEKWQ
jgi:two-component system response regulator AgrA